MKNKNICLFTAFCAFSLLACGCNSDEGAVSANSIPSVSEDKIIIDTLSENEVSEMDLEQTFTDRFNLFTLENTVSFEGFDCSGQGGDQNGYEMTSEFLNALVPGSVIEIKYISNDNNIWLVFPLSDEGWVRVGMNDAFINEEGNIAQIRYEQIAELLGDDKSKWGPVLQCEDDSPWHVYDISVGTPMDEPDIIYREYFNYDGYKVSGNADSPNGLPFTDEFLEALRPGTVIRIEYTSTDDTLWLEVPYDTIETVDENGDPIETEVPDPINIGGNYGNGTFQMCENGICYITYDQMVTALGKDMSKWASTLNCNSSSSWQVTSLSIGTLSAPNPHVRGLYEFEGFEASGDKNTASGYEMDDEFIKRLVPGCVIVVKYTSTDNSMWVTFSWAKNGYMQCGKDDAILDINTCYVTYDSIVSKCGEDVSLWGTRLDCESLTDWNVSALYIGTLDTYNTEENISYEQ